MNHLITEFGMFTVGENGKHQKVLIADVLKTCTLKSSPIKRQGHLTKNFLYSQRLILLRRVPQKADQVRGELHDRYLYFLLCSLFSWH